MSVVQEHTATIIATNKKGLTQFIMDLCAYTLDQAGFESQAYASHLHIAFRHQLILQDKAFEEFNSKIDEECPLTWESDKALLKAIQDFAQSVVTEITQSQQDNWAIKLIKTSYLSHIDNARKNSEFAMQKIAGVGEEFSASLILGELENKPSDEKLAYAELLKAHIDYLDTLSSLPFVLEQFCVSLAQNSGYNYQPGKTAQMLAASLDTVSLAISSDSGMVQDIAVEGLKQAILIAMPELPIDENLTAIIEKNILPFINTILKKSSDFEEKKKEIFDNEKHSKARKEVFKFLGVEFESLTDIITATLVKPATEFSNAFEELAQLSGAIYSAATNPNAVDQLLDITDAFKHFDKIAAVCDRVDSNLLPPWIQQTNNYYNLLKKGIEIPKNAALGLGTFFNFTSLLIPQAVKNYFSQQDELKIVLKKLNPLHDDDGKIYKTITAYFSFYDLMSRAEIEDPFKEKLFTIFIEEIIKEDKGNNFEGKDFDYNKYQLLEKQLSDKKDLNINKSLKDRINDFKLDFFPSNSILIAQQANKINSNQEFDILILINRLQHLEASFSPISPASVLNEVLEAYTAINESEHAVHKAFQQQFLAPALNRMMTKVNNELLIPLLEKMLDEKEKHLAFSQTLREVYSKLKEDISLNRNEYDILEEIWQKYPKGKITPEHLAYDEKLFKCINNALQTLPSNEKPLTKEYLTPKEELYIQAKDTFETIKPLINNVLKALRRQLTQQRNDCMQLERLVKESSDVEKLVKAKKAYINKLNALINGFEIALENNHDLQKHVRDLLSGEIPSILTPLEIRKNVSVKNIPNQLIRFAWHVLPDSSVEGSKVNETFIYNFFNYYLTDTLVGDVVAAEKEYSELLNKNPIPALMKSLNDPLASANIIPAQEQIMDAIIGQLIETSNQTVVSWGVTYLKDIVTEITHAQLLKLLPYPFLANIALQALQSQALQNQLAPIYTKFINEYGGYASDAAQDVMALAKEKLYPILGIEIQKSIEQCVYNYASDPDNASIADRDTFALYALQYVEIKRNNKDLDKKDAIEFLFPQLLEAKKDTKQAVIDKLHEEFEKVDTSLKCEPAQDATKVLENQLDFLLKNFDFDNAGQKPLIQASLFNNLLMMAMESSNQISNADKQNHLQILAIEKLSTALGLMKENIPDDVDGFVVINSIPKMIESMAGARKKAEALQLQRLESQIEAAERLVSSQITDHDKMLASKAPLLGISLFEWEYRQSNKKRLTVKAFSFLYELYGVFSSWATLAAGGGLVPGLLMFFGVASGIGASATGIGAIVVGATALLRLSIKFGQEIWHHRKDFKDLGEKSFLSRIGGGIKLVGKCLGLAIAKTFLSDYVVANLSTYLAFGPVRKIRDAFRKWPTKQTVTDEREALNEIKTLFTGLKDAIGKQKQYIEGLSTENQAHVITEDLERLQKRIEAAKGKLKSVDKNDARFSKRGYQEILDQYQSYFEKLDAEINRMLELSNSIKDLPVVQKENEAVEQNEQIPAPIVDNIDEQSQAVVIKLEEYQQKHERFMALAHEDQQVGLLGKFWHWFIKIPGSESQEQERNSQGVEGDFENQNIDEMLDSFVFVDEDQPEVTPLLASCSNTNKLGEFVVIEDYSREKHDPLQGNQVKARQLIYNTGFFKQQEDMVNPAASFAIDRSTFLG